jgi:hypothetical protein
MAQKIARIKSGETSDLWNPDPEFVDLVTRDPECVKKICGLVFLTELTTSDVSDQRLARLAELPNLRRVALNDTVGTDVFLKHLRRSESLTSVEFCRSRLHGEGITAKGIEHLAEIPNLRRLQILFGVSYRMDLAPLEKCLSLERLLLGYYNEGSPSEPVPADHLDVLERLPKLRSLSLEGCKITDQTVDRLKAMSRLEELDIFATSEQVEELRRALPTAVFPPSRQTQQPSTDS